MGYMTSTKEPSRPPTSPKNSRMV